MPKAVCLEFGFIQFRKMGIVGKIRKLINGNYTLVQPKQHILKLKGVVYGSQVYSKMFQLSIG